MSPHPTDAAGPMEPFARILKIKRRACRSRDPLFDVTTEPGLSRSKPPGSLAANLNPDGDIPMRVMVLVKANKDSEAGVMPSQEILTDMGKFNEELVKAGVMLAGEGLHPTSKA